MATFFLADFFFAITNTPSLSRNNPSLPTPAPAFNPPGLNHVPWRRGEARGDDGYLSMAVRNSNE